MSLGGRGRALPESLRGPWGLSPSVSHQEGLLSEYRAPRIYAWRAPFSCQFFQAFPSTWKQSGSGWSFFHFSVERYSQKERSVSAHQQENEEDKMQHAGVLTAAWNRMIKKMLQFISWAWLYLRISSWCSIKHLDPYGKHFYGDCFLISKLLKQSLLVFVLPRLVTLALGAALYQKCPTKRLKCFVISSSDSPLSSLSVYL